MSQFVFARRPDLERSWPFVHQRLVERLGAQGQVQVVPLQRDQALGEHADLQEVDAVALFGGRLTVECVARAPRLKAIGCNTDNTGRGLPLAALAARGIPIVDTTRAWGQSVAEIALSLALSALRRVPQWHADLAGGARSFEYEAVQYCDATGFANGELGTKRIGIIGLGQIGGRVARWCAALGTDAATGPDLAGQVLGYDPYLPDGVAERWGVHRVDVDSLVDESEVVFVTVPPTPTAKHLLDRSRIQRLRRGALVVIVTRAHAVDMDALRERIVADELCAALDVYDVEPLPLDDPLRGRPNVVHTPHIAGRTRDANLRTADLLTDDFARILRGEPPHNELTPAAIQARTGEAAPR
ncbi:MAG: NAD(P)-dependent oxidoreductase [Chloroflexota bacterium]